MQKTIHKTDDKNHARRLTALLMFHRGDTVSDVAKSLCCTRSSLGAGLIGSRFTGNHSPRAWTTLTVEQICAPLRQLIKFSPSDFGYQRSCWSTELLEIKINEIAGCSLHASMVRRWLPSAGLVWRRSAATLRI